MIYTDQFGQDHIPQGDYTPAKRQGIFGICIVNNHVLLSWPQGAPDLAEFPGGGIDPGEDKPQALIREIEEEADVFMKEVKPVREHDQHVKYFSNAADGFWDYDQSFWVLDEALLAPYFFEGERSPEDALKSRWVPLAEFKDMKLHAMHQKAREALGL